MRRILTAREQFAMMSPWRERLAWELSPHQKSVVDEMEPDLTQLADLPEHGGRWAFPHLERTEPSGYQSNPYHTWGIYPTDAPAQHDYTKMGRSGTFFYDPAQTDIEEDEFRDRAAYRGNNIDEDLLGLSRGDRTPGIVWRGLSNEEMEDAKQKGYFQSNGSYNFAGQEGTTLFDEHPGTAQSYANSYSPYQFIPTFSRPAHVIGIPDQNYPRNSVGEVEIPGRIPLDAVTHHYRGDVTSIDPGSYGGYQGSMPNAESGFNGWSEEPTRTGSPRATVKWSPGEFHRGR